MRPVKLVLHCVQALAQGISVGTLAVPALLGPVGPLAFALRAGISSSSVGVRGVSTSTLRVPALLGTIGSPLRRLSSLPLMAHRFTQGRRLAPRSP